MRTRIIRRVLRRPLSGNRNRRLLFLPNDSRKISMRLNCSSFHIRIINDAVGRLGRCDAG